ncbi:ATP-binding cassette domain-containing protein [Paludibaculum fermentans]|uniref:ABC transporter ATP-binding protein n=1 Tax=Paludibaculum fermentans TaxID=1473598 RepID=UPI003EBBDA11
MIRIDKVTRRFGQLVAVKDLSLEIAEGEIFGLVGPDGAGKTTTLRMLVGLMDPTEGSLSVAGLDVGKNLDAVKDQIGYMAQKFGLYGDLTVEENMFFYSDLFGIEPSERDRMMAEFLDMTRMTPFRQRPAAKLSGGMKQKLALMCTLLHRPRVLFLDEPTNGVDPLSRRDFWEILYRLAGEGMTILVSTAYLDEAERCTRVGLMHKGRLIRCDKPATLKQQLAPQSFRAESADLRAARGRLQHTPGVLGAEPAGAALHVYLEEGASAAEVERAAGDVRLTPLDPALEDVFIALIRKEERHAAA